MGMVEMETFGSLKTNAVRFSGAKTVFCVSAEIKQAKCVAARRKQRKFQPSPTYLADFALRPNPFRPFGFGRSLYLSGCLFQAAAYSACAAACTFNTL
ncbi:hypothetical protein [Kingella potus]|uniref:hypothetical protein n=1 Tax=Kingella potus TaxID=265175 RepID=UPI0011C0312A|nr:hypothetical protein [Kingella potus]